MQPRPKSFTYTTGIKWLKGPEATLSSPGKPDIHVSTPPEFRGPEGNWTPENLYIAAIESCMLFTFLALARSRKLDFKSYSSTAEGLLEPLEGVHVVSRVTVKPQIVLTRAEDMEKAQTITQDMEKHCFISNSVETEVLVEPTITS